MERGRRLLWVDCIGGFVVGALMLLFGHWLSTWYGLSWGLLLFMGAANGLYASYSFSLARQVLPARPRIALLVVANLTWCVICAVLAWQHWEGASVLGRIHLLGEGAYVGGLGCLEWRFRDQLGRGCESASPTGQ